jgi:putative endonuclease
LPLLWPLCLPWPLSLLWPSSLLWPLLFLFLPLFVPAVILSEAKDLEEFLAPLRLESFGHTSEISKEPCMPEGHVYILGSTTGTLYTGVTSKFDRRLFEHKNNINSAFPSKHRCNRLLLRERYVDIRSAIAREKELKGWTRTKKLALITQTNPQFKDLAAQHGWLTLHPQQNIADQK